MEVTEFFCNYVTSHIFVSGMNMNCLHTNRPSHDKTELPKEHQCSYDGYSQQEE